MPTVLSSAPVHRVVGMGDASERRRRLAWLFHGHWGGTPGVRWQGLFLRILSGAAFPLILTTVFITIPTRPAKSEAPTPYPLEICIVSGDKLGGDSIVFSYQGREIKTCCTNCIDEFYKDPAGYVAKIEEAAGKVEK